MSFAAGAIGAFILGLKCPHCGKVQARARRPRDRPIRCRACRKTFSRAEGEVLYREWKLSSSRARR